MVRLARRHVPARGGVGAGVGGGGPGQRVQRAGGPLQPRGVRLQAGHRHLHLHTQLQLPGNTRRIHD